MMLLYVAAVEDAAEDSLRAERDRRLAQSDWMGLSGHYYARRMENL